MKLKVAIIGCGDMGEFHYNAWKKRDDVEIVSICDPIEERLQKSAETTQAKPYKTYQDAICHEGVNCVSVCIPTHLHSEVTCFAAEQGRNVFCEKPIALTIEQADRMLETTKRNNVLLSVDFQCRGSSRIIKYKELFENGTFGGPIHFNIIDVREVRPKLAMHYENMNGGPVIDLLCHFTDMMRYITGAEPVRVHATGDVFGKGKPRLDGISDLAIDASNVIVEMEKRNVLNVTLNWGMPEGFKAQTNEFIAGPNLAAKVNNDHVELFFNDHVQIWPDETPGVITRINDFADAVLGKSDLEVTGENGKIALEVSLAALESIKTGQSVSLKKEKYSKQPSF